MYILLNNRIYNRDLQEYYLVVVSEKNYTPPYRIRTPVEVVVRGKNM